MKVSVGLISLLFLQMSCATIKNGESWKMRSEDKTIGLTLLWNLPEAKIREIVPPNQVPRIQNGTAF